jgi:hypothetical protein
MYFCGRMTPSGMAIAIKIARKEVTAKARMRSFILHLRSPFFFGEWDLSGRDIVDREPPLSSVYGRLFTTMVVFGISRYGVPFFSLDGLGGSRYSVGVSLRWYVERRWLGGGMARPYALAMLRGDGRLVGLDKTDKGMGGVSEDIEPVVRWRGTVGVGPGGVHEERDVVSRTCIPRF